MASGVEIFSLKEKSVLVTGATGYLGRAMAYTFAEAGAKVFVNSRVKQDADAFVAELEGEGHDAESAVFDVTSAAAIAKFSERIKGNPLNVLVNNAYSGGSGSIEFGVSEFYAKSYDVSVISAHRLLVAMLPNLRMAVRQCGDAAVINIASMYGFVSPDQRVYRDQSEINPPFYGAAKAALLQWTRYAACEFGKEKIRVNAISPGPFPAPSVQVADPKFVAALSAKVPMGRIGASDEIKGPALFLASAASTFVNGENLVVDGGWTCW